MENHTHERAGLDRDTYFALMQLCSTAYLASRPLDEPACTRLVRARLAWQDGDGYWRATDEGRAVFAELQ